MQANLLAALTDDPAAINQVYNVAVDDRTSLNQLFELLRDAIARECPSVADVTPVYRDFRPGDVRHSQADIGKARRLLGYAPTHRLADGIDAAMPWYLAHFAARRSATAESSPARCVMAYRPRTSGIGSPTSSSRVCRCRTRGPSG